MSGLLRCIVVLGAIFLFIFVLKKIRQSKLKIDYTVFWIVFVFVLLSIGIFPELVYVFSKVLGFQSPINCVFLMVIFILIIKQFLMSIQLSQLESKVDHLVQNVALERATKEGTQEREEQNK